MSHFDTNFAPLYRSAIGFDHLADLMQKMQDDSKYQSTYPPHNIELLGENLYRISMAVAGFSLSELHIESKERLLTVTGKKSNTETKTTYLHQGIANRNFEHKFQLADHIKVIDATLEHGLLHIDLEREIPEAQKTKRIPINTSRKK